MAGEAAAAAAAGPADRQQGSQDNESLGREQLAAAAAEAAAAAAALRARRELAELNASPQRPGEDELSKRDSSIKKNGALVKRLRAVTEDGRAALLADMQKLNLSKYVTEAVAALAEAPPPRAQDAAAAADVAGVLHRTYAGFGDALGAALARAFGARLSGEDERAHQRRQRGTLRLLCELVAARVVPDAAALVAAVRELAAATADRRKDAVAAAAAASLLGSAAAPIAAGALGAPPPQLPPAAAGADARLEQPSEGAEAAAAADAADPETAAAITELRAAIADFRAEAAAQPLPSTNEREALKRELERAYEAAAAHLLESHAALLEAERSGASVAAPDAAGAAEYAAARRAHEALLRAAAQLAEALGRPPPALPDSGVTRISGAGDGSASGGGGGDAAPAVEHVFEDPEARAFYESLPDLAALVPLALLADATGPAVGGRRRGGGGGGGGEPRQSSGGGGDGDGGGDGKDAAAAEPKDGKEQQQQQQDKDKDKEKEPDKAAPEDRSAADAVIARLQSCVTRELADEIAVNFCYANSRGARRRLARALTEVPRGGQQLLPFWGRVAAAVSTCYPEVGAAVVTAVEAGFDAQLAARRGGGGGVGGGGGGSGGGGGGPNFSDEERLRTARYLAELVKFRLAAPGGALTRLRACLDDFAGANVDAAAALVESCGRFLIRLPEARVRMDNLLGVMTRLAAARNLDARQAAAVEAAYFACRPPDAAAARRRRRGPPLQEYAEHLIFERLGRGGGAIVAVLKQLMRLPWPEAEKYVLPAMLSVASVRAAHVPLIASLAAGLAQHHESLGVALVDAALEELLWGLENPSAGNYQARLANMRLLGELYNYMLVDSRTVFDALYAVIGHGHAGGPPGAARLDPPGDFFRARMAAALLAACGQYFKRGAAGRRLDRFLAFFWAYYLAKGPAPLDVDFDVQDMLEHVRPNARRPADYAAAAAAVEEILAREAAAAAAGGAPSDDDDDDEEGDDGGGARGGSDEGNAAEAAAAGSGSGSEEDDDDDDEGSGSGLSDYDRGPGDGAAAVDEDFEREWAALMQETAPAAVGVGAAAAAAAAAAAGGAGEGHHASSTAAAASGAAPAPAVALRVLVKRGGRDDRSRELAVPATSALAARVLAARAADDAERAAVKRATLLAHARDDDGSGGGLGGAGAGGSGGGRRKRGGQQQRFAITGGGRGPGLHFME